jgi:Gluconate 2-dehydrogenase subunit 3
MNRRSAIRNVVIISAGASFLPSCFNKDKTVFPLKNISLSGSQQNMLGELAETIIPKTKTFAGAKDLKAHEFVMTMVDDCYPPDAQKKFTDGMTQFEKLAKDKSGKSFINADAKQKNDLLTQIESKKDIPEDAMQFYQTVKRHTVQAFTSSKEYLIDVRHYKIVPGGNFKGCVPVKS